MDHPRGLIEFIELYPTEEACAKAIFEHRWPEGFVCSRCGSKDAWHLRHRGLYECAHCHYQGSLTAGTVFQASLTHRARDICPAHRRLSQRDGREHRHWTGEGGPVSRQTEHLVYRPTALDAVAVMKSLVPHISETHRSLLPVAKSGSGLLALQSFLLLLAFAKVRADSGRNFVLVADEPELHLHPSLHRKLANRIRAVSGQSLVVTQSPGIASAYKPNDVLFLTRTAGSAATITLRRDPISAIPTNAIRNLYTRHRAACCDALMGNRLLVPEGTLDFEWLTLWQRVVETSPAGIDSVPLGFCERRSKGRTVVGRNGQHWEAILAACLTSFQGVAARSVAVA